MSFWVSVAAAVQMTGSVSLLCVG